MHSLIYTHGQTRTGTQKGNEMALYEITATQNRYVKIGAKSVQCEEGYVVNRSWQNASSHEEAIDLAKNYISAKYDHIRAELVRA